jgi:hypothetical protein
MDPWGGQGETRNVCEVKIPARPRSKFLFNEIIREINGLYGPQTGIFAANFDEKSWS